MPPRDPRDSLVWSRQSYCKGEGMSRIFKSRYHHIAVRICTSFWGADHLVAARVVPVLASSAVQVLRLVSPLPNLCSHLSPAHITGMLWGTMALPPRCGVHFGLMRPHGMVSEACLGSALHIFDRDLVRCRLCQRRLKFMPGLRWTDFEGGPALPERSA